MKKASTFRIVLILIGALGMLYFGLIFCLLAFPVVSLPLKQWQNVEWTYVVPLLASVIGYGVVSIGLLRGFRKARAL